VQGELGDLLIFQQEHDNCFSDLVKISKTMEGKQQDLTSKGLNLWGGEGVSLLMQRGKK